jgi:hypothetical protein
VEYGGVTGPIAVVISGNRQIVRVAEVKSGDILYRPEAGRGTVDGNIGNAVTVIVPGGR